MPRRVYNGVPQSWAKYNTRINCSRECYKASKAPPERYCPVCGDLLVRGEGEIITDFRNRIFCPREKGCVTKELKRRARKARFIKLQRDRCSVFGCNEPVGDGLLYLCTKHFEEPDSVPEAHRLELPSKREADALLPTSNKIIEGIRRKLTKKALVFTGAEYKQDELEFYLMTPAQRREVRRSYDRQARSER